jgi:DNA-binding transcriptional ArsR family regulator
MRSDIGTLPKILKDPTRQQILTLLNERGNIRYTELLEEVGFVSTGTLNYHLKVLGDLLAKNEAGQYMLSEKGKLAYKLITAIPEDTPKQKRVWQRRFFIGLGVGQVVYFAVALAFYYWGYIDLYRLTTATIGFVVASVTLYFIWRMVRNGTPTLGSVQMQKRIKIAYIAAGLSAGVLVAFLGGGIVLHLISDLQGIRFTTNNPLYHFFWSTPYLVFSMIIAPIIGGYLGYWAGKRRGFEQPKWAQWVEAHIG